MVGGTAQRVPNRAWWMNSEELASERRRPMTDGTLAGTVHDIWSWGHGELPCWGILSRSCGAG